MSLKNVAKSISMRHLKPQWADKFNCIVGEWAGHNFIRNTIAHNRWTDGQRSNTIKPRYVKIREGRADWFGNDESETDFLAADLDRTAHALHLINERLKSFLIESGLQKIIEEKMDLES